MENNRPEKEELKLPFSFFEREDTVQIAKELLGKELYTRFDGKITAGIIVETECYLGAEDKASHAYNNRRTQRTEAMYANGGVIYVYLCYGMHHLLNIVTNKQNVPHAILIRALEPTVGIDLMLKRRKKKQLDYTLANGPGSLSRALGITIKHNKLLLQGDKIWVQKKRIISEDDIICSPRVGIAYAKEHALLPWRFREKKSRWTSAP